MKRKTLGMVALALVLLGVALPTLGAGVEMRVGTGPSLSILADWQATRWLDLGVSLGVGFGHQVQTPAMVVQTPSVTAGVHARITFAQDVRSVVPYVDMGFLLEFQRPAISGMAQFAGGLRVRITSNLYLLGEAALIVPVLGPGDQRFSVLGGIRYRF